MKPEDNAEGTKEPMKITEVYELKCSSSLVGRYDSEQDAVKAISTHARIMGEAWKCAGIMAVSYTIEKLYCVATKDIE